MDALSVRSALLTFVSVCIVGGFTLRQVDWIYCHSADSLIQLHALFHFLVAVGLTTGQAHGQK